MNYDYNSYDDLTNGSVASLLRRKAIFDQFGQQSPDDSVDSPVQTSQAQPVRQGQTEMPPQVAPVPMPQGHQQQPDDFASIMDYVDQHYHPEHTATDRLNAFLDSFPNEDDYRPSIGRRLVSIGVGLGKGGAEAQDKYLDEPYTGELAKWKERAGPFQSAATLENQQNINERQLMTGMGQNAVAQRKTDEIQRQNDARNQLTQQRIDIASAKAHNYKIMIEGARVVAHNPNPPFDSVDLGPSGGLDKATELDIRGGYQVDAAKAAAGGALQRTQASGQGMFQIGDKTYIPNPDDPTHPLEVQVPAGAATKLGTPKTPPVPNPKNEPINISNTLARIYATGSKADKDQIEHIEGGLFTLKPKPELSGGILGWGAVTDQDIKNWEHVAKQVYPDLFPAADSIDDTNITGGDALPNVGGAGPKVGPKVGDRVGNTPPPRTPARTLDQQQQAIQSGESALIQDATGKQFLVPANLVDQYIATKKYTKVK